MRIFYVFVFLYLFPAFATAGETYLVSIEPQRWMLEQLVGPETKVITLLPPTADPHTFEPSVKELVLSRTAKALFIVGHERLPFEAAWREAASRENRNLLIVSTTKGIAADPLDPHLWVSPEYVPGMLQNMAEGLAKLEPARAAETQQRLSLALAKVQELDEEIRELLAPFAGRPMVVFHPSWRYFTDRYALRLLPLEDEGKEPDPARLMKIVRGARAAGAKVIFSEPQRSGESAAVFARELGGTVVVLDPLAYDWPGTLRKAATEIAKSYQP